MNLQAWRVTWLAVLLSSSASAFAVELPRMSPFDGLTRLWQIGETDNAAAEFALSPDDFARFGEQFPDGALFIVGRSDPKVDWPFVHPGPVDAWVGFRRHTFTIIFGLATAPPDGTCRLVLDLVDAHRMHPPRFEVRVNDQTSEHQTVAGTANALETRGSDRREQRFTVEFPAAALRAGNNVVTITSLAGSWFIYDAVTCEVPADARLAPVEPETTIVSAAGSPVLCQSDAGGSTQQLRLRVRHTGDPLAATVVIGDGPPESVRLRTGTQSLALAAPAVEQPTTVVTALQIGDRTLSTISVELKPVRRWVIYLLPHSHVDIGYTHVQTEVEQKQWANLELALETARRTAEYPEGARFRWNVEVMWAVDGYLRQASPDRQQAFVDAVKSGWIELDALYGNELTALCRPEELFRLVECAGQVAHRCGVPLQSAMISDVPGYTWGIVPVLAQAGVKYFSVGPNHSDRIGGTLAEWGDRPFYWVSPAGDERVLCWVAGKGYAFFHRGSLGNLGMGPLLAYLDQLAERSYPYDLVQLRYTVGGDNGPPDPTLCDFVREWNARHASPRLVIATTSEMCRAFEERYHDQIPTARGDFTPYWEDGAGSSARETALNRAAAERLGQAETLFAIRAAGQFPAAEFQAAWRNVLLYDEHTWGAHNSISEPDAPFVKDQWKIKQTFALDADRQSRALLARAAGESPASGSKLSAVDVFNTSSWRRTELVTLPKELETVGDIVQGPDGALWPSQRLSTGELVFLAQDVPPLAAARCSFAGGPAPRGGAATADGTRLNTPRIGVRVDEHSGAIVGLHGTAVRAELVDTQAPVAVNDYRYVLGSDVAGAQGSRPPTITVLEAGPLVAALRIESVAPGCRKLVREVRVIDGVDHVEITNVLDKEPVRQKEGVHFGFAFHVPDGVMRMDIPWAVAQPETDQLPGACKNWFTVQRWVDVSNPAYGVTWATFDAPLVEVGAMTADRIGSLSDPNAWLKHIEPSQTLYSWAMNNHWHTNYKADQDGPTVFRYAILPHGGFDFAGAQRFGLERTQPLVVVPAGREPPAAAPLRVEPADVIVATLRPSADGRALLLRLFNTTDRPATAQVRLARPYATLSNCDLLERPGEPIRPDSVDLPPWGVRSLRCEVR